MTDGLSGCQFGCEQREIYGPPPNLLSVAGDQFCLVRRTNMCMLRRGDKEATTDWQYSNSHRLLNLSQAIVSIWRPYLIDRMYILYYYLGEMATASGFTPRRTQYAYAFPVKMIVSVLVTDVSNPG